MDVDILRINFWPVECDPKRLSQSDHIKCLADAANVDNNEYALKYPNRGWDTFRSEGLLIRAMALPLKLRSGYDRDTVRVRSRGEANINGNVFVGYRFGSEKYFYERGATRNPYTRFHITPGVFVGASVVALGKETSKTAAVPLTESFPMGALSGGVGALVGWRNFSLGVFRGWDYGLGNSANDWDFNRRPYTAVGITIDSFLEGVRL